MHFLIALAILGQTPTLNPPDSLRVSARPLPKPDRWFAMDKLWHFSASFVTVGAAYHLAADRANLSSPLSTGLAAGGTLTLGITKEFCDLAGPTKRFSWKDLVADAAGVGAGYLVFIHRY